MKEVSGRKVELDEVIVPAPLLESGSSQKTVSATPTPISEEVNDDDHETSDQVITEPRRSTRVRSALEWYGNPVLEVMLLDHDETTSMLDNTMPLGKFLDEQLARVRENEIIETDNIDDEGSPPRYELPVVPEGYVMDEEATRAILACNDRYDQKGY